MKLAAKIILGVVGTLAALVALVVGFRDPLVSFLGRRSLEGRGLVCNEVEMHVPFAWPPTPIQLEPTRCGIVEGPRRMIEFKAPLLIHVGQGETRITCESIDVDMRPQPHPKVEMNVLGDVTRLAGYDEPGVELMFDSAELSRDDSPPFSAAHAMIRWSGKPVVEFTDLRVVSTDDGMVVVSPHADIQQTAPLGPGALRLKATPLSATVTVLYGGGIKAKLDIQHMQTKAPKAVYSLEASGKPSPGGGQTALE